MNIGMIGAGKWGKNLLHVFNSLATVKRCANKHDVSWVKENYPDISTSLNYRDILDDNSIDAVVIAAPINQLSKIAGDAIAAGKHIFLEKPMAHNLFEAKKLADLPNNKILFLGYIFLYNQIYKELKKLTANDPIVNIEITVEKFGTFKEDILLNLVSHELAIVMGLFNSSPEKISLENQKGILSEMDILKLNLGFENDKSATINMNRFHPKKNKTIMITTKSGKILYWINSQLFKYNSEDNCFELHMSNDEEPLVSECKEFLSSVENNKRSVSNAEFGIKVLEVIDKIKNEKET